MCSSSQELVRRIEGRMRKQYIGCLNYICILEKTLGTDKANLLHLARHRKRLMKRSGHAADHVLRRTGLWAGAVPPISGPTKCTPCDMVQNVSVLSLTYQNEQATCSASYKQDLQNFLIPFFSKSSCNDVMQM